MLVNQFTESSYKSQAITDQIETLFIAFDFNWVIDWSSCDWGYTLHSYRMKGLGKQWHSQDVSTGGGGGKAREWSDRAGGGMVGRFLKIWVSKWHFLPLHCKWLCVVA